jgi:GTP-binding protein
VPVDSADAAAEYALLRREVSSHSPLLARVPHCLVLSKADLLAPGEAPPAVEAPDAWGTFVVSAVSRRGLAELTQALWARTREVVAAEREGEPEEEWWVP